VFNGVEAIISFITRGEANYTLDRHRLVEQKEAIYRERYREYFLTKYKHEVYSQSVHPVGPHVSSDGIGSS
jgi:hypothetical protein